MKKLTSILLSILLTLSSISPTFALEVTEENNLNSDEIVTENIDNTESQKDSILEEEKQENSSKEEQSSTKTKPKSTEVKQKVEEKSTEKEEKVEESSKESTSDSINNETVNDETVNDLTGNYSEIDDVEAISLYNEAAENKKDAIDVLIDELSFPKKDAKEVAEDLFDIKGNRALTKGDNDEEDIPRQGDGSNIEYISAKWITPDTITNDDDNLLYYKPSGNSQFDIRLQINYALSGEHNYEPGDIIITIPENIIKNRNGKYACDVILPFPEDPSTKADFNWKLIDGNYVLTNTKKMSAATKGYIQIGFDGLVPSDLVDMEVSEDFDAYIEVTTHKGNIIALRSNKLSAQFDTEARIVNNSLRKKQYQTITRVPASEIPEEQRIEGEEEYILVKWYLWASITANTYYTMDIVDHIPQDAQVTDTLKESDVHGFIIGATSEDGITLEKDNVYSGYKSGQTNHYYYETAYPASQFEPNVQYTFHNAAEMVITEVDPEATVTNANVQIEDPQLKTEAEASTTAIWSYTLPEWYNPTGHFMVCKNGNDDKVGKNKTHHSSHPGGSSSDIHIWKYGNPIDRWYGIYPSGMNELDEGNNINLSYTIDSVGYTMPWMFDAGSFSVDGEMASRKSVNYTKPVTIVTEDTGVRLGNSQTKLNVFEDYEFVSIEFPPTPYVYTGTPKNINPDGTWQALTAGDGTFEYTLDNNYNHYPDIILELYRNGAWEKYATASWKTGSVKITLENGTELSGDIVNVPSDTENFRTKVTLQNTLNNGSTISQAAIDYDVRPLIKLINTDTIKQIVSDGFAHNPTPSMTVYNSVNMKAYDASNEEIVSIDKEGHDVLRGYTTDISVYPSKSSTQSLKDADYVNRRVTIHYSAKVEERSVINDSKTYNQAIEDGRLQAETHGFWYDLLPKGVTPDLSSIKLRSKDKIISARTVENYKNSGRTLLIVEANLTPVPQTYRSGDMYYYEDVPTIKFDAWYDFDALTDYGKVIHNVIAFESSNDKLGTINGYSGEYDNPNTGNDQNVSTYLAFKTEDEKEWMTNLDPEKDTPSFVYAGSNTTIDIISAARLSLQKDVMVNNDGIWGTGVFNSDRVTGEEGNTYQYNEQSKKDNEMVVWEGGLYSYKLRMMPDDETRAKDMVIYDSLETFKASDGNEPIDEMAANANATWQGDFMGVDVSQIIDKGGAPVVYYSTIRNLALSDESNPDIGLKSNMLFKDDGTINSNIWTKAEDYEGDLSEVTAIAVDASKKPDGSDFTLEPLESIVILINMHAPSGDVARDIIANAGAWGTSAYAYNNAYLTGTTIDINTLDEDGENFVRKDYTKVGLVEYKYEVKKVWNDGDNRDGKRPDNVTVHLLADGQDTGQTLVLHEDDNWEAAFEHIPYTTPEGQKIKYSITEDSVNNYLTDISATGTNAVITNSYEPERISLNVSKNWENDTEEDRPPYITVELYGNGTKVTSKRIDASTDWKCEFTNLYKNENGLPIIYTAKEIFPNRDIKHLSYIANEPNGILLTGGTLVPVSEGNVFTNTRHPYGDLYVSKLITGVTSVSKEQEFEFTFNFSQMMDGEMAPVLTEYDYDILDDNNDIISTGKISNNGVIKIKGGQKIHIKEIEEYVHYSVSENNEEGFILSKSTNTEGNIKPNTDTQVSFTNKYSAKGNLNLKADKTLNNRNLRKYQFKFEVYEVVEQDDGNGNVEIIENLIRTATNGQVDNTVEREDGTVESSHAEATFGAFHYTQEDAEKQIQSGKPYRYKIIETNGNREGYIYDSTIYYVDVAITDNGDGTLNIVPTYYKEIPPENGGFLDDLGDLIFGEDDPTYEEVEKASFVNDYKAEGEIVLRAWKDLQGRNLNEGDFEFELLDDEGQVIQTKPNSADGSVVFDAIKFNEESIGKTYNFGIREKVGNDATINYDFHVYGYTVIVYDNGDGTLSFSQTPATPIYSKDIECDVCHGVNSKNYYTIGSIGYFYHIEEMYNAFLTLAEAINLQEGRNYIDLKEHSDIIDLFNTFMHCAENAGYINNYTDLNENYTAYLDMGYPGNISVGYYCSSCGNKIPMVCEACGGTGIDSNHPDAIYITDPDVPMIFGTRESTYMPNEGTYAYRPDFTTYQTYDEWYDASKYPFMKTLINGHYTCENKDLYSPGTYYIYGTYNVASEIRVGGENETLANGWRQLLKDKRNYTDVEANEAIPNNSGVYSIHFRDMDYDSYGGYYRMFYDVKYHHACEECNGSGEGGYIVGWNTNEGELPIITNTLKDGNLCVKKNISNPDEADMDQLFKFKVKLIGDNIENKEWDYDLAQAKNTKITIYVIDEFTGEPLEGVNCYMNSYANGYNESAQTDADGRVVFNDIVAGDYTFSTWYYGYTVAEGGGGDWSDTLNIRVNADGRGDFYREITGQPSLNATEYVYSMTPTNAAPVPEDEPDENVSEGMNKKLFDRSSDVTAVMDSVESDEKVSEERFIDKIIIPAYGAENDNITLTFDANGGSFSNGTTSNTITYTEKETQYSHTANISDAGVRSGGMGTNLRLRNIVTIPDANKLFATVKYGTYNNVNGAAIYVFNKRYTGTPTSTSGSYGQIDRLVDTAGINTPAKYTINGNTMTFFVYSGSNSYNSNASSAYGYGYYATITGYALDGTYSIPQTTGEHMRFKGWTKNANGTGTVYKTEEDAIKNVSTGTTLYAQYEPAIIASGNWWTLYDDGELVLKGNASESSPYTFNLQNGQAPWYNYRTQIKSVKTDGYLKANYYLSYMFNGCSNLETVDLSGLIDTSNVTTMTQMFQDCSHLKSVDLSHLNLSRVTNMSSIFNRCYWLETIDFPTTNGPSPTTLSKAFYNCSRLKAVDLSHFNTANLTSLENTFYDCPQLASVNMDGLNLSNVTTLYYTFYRTESLKASPIPANANFARLTTAASAFYESGIETIDMSGWNTPSLTNMTYMFSRSKIKSIVGMDQMDTSHVTNMSQMFYCCYDLESFDFPNLDTSRVTTFYGMFQGCRSLQSVDCSNWNTSSATNMEDMFEWCKALSALDLSSFDTSHVTRMNYMISGCDNLRFLDISSFDISNISYLSGLFSGDISLRRVNLSENMNPWSAQSALPKPVGNTKYTGKWIKEDGTAGPLTPVQLCDQYPDNASEWAGIWVWEEDPDSYVISFDRGKEDVTGYMSSVRAKADEDYVIPACKFNKIGYNITAWKDQDGNEYPVGNPIPANTYAALSKVTLTPVFTKDSSINTHVSMEDGEFEFTLHGNEKVTFDGIPAGTAYQVYEETPDGWVLIEQSNTSGIIEPLETSVASFTNKYEPGTTTAQFFGTKTLDGQAAEAESFSFVLDETTEGASGNIKILVNGEEQNVELPYTVTVSEGGFIQFPVIKYSIDDIGEHTYTIKEVNPNDEHIDYDTHIEKIKVNVTGDVTELKAETVIDENGDGKISFANKTRPGELRITKNGQNVTDVNKDDEFTFKVTLSSDKGLPFTDNDTLDWYTVDSSGNVVQHGNANDNNGQAGNESADNVQPSNVKIKASSAAKSFNAENKISFKNTGNLKTGPSKSRSRSTEGTAYAVLDNSGNMIFFRSNDTYANDTTGTFTDILGNTYIGKIFADIETTDEVGPSSCKWDNYRTNIKIVKVADGQTIQPISCDCWFYGCTNMTLCNLEGLDTESVTEMSGMFTNCSSLTSLDISGFDTRNVAYMRGMFSGCSSLMSLDVSGFDTGKVISMEYMFTGCSKLTSLDVSGFDTSKVTHIEYMFSGCSGLTSLDVSRFDTSKVLYMRNMFYNCSALTNLDLSRFDTSKVQYIENMFNDCDILSTINIGPDFSFKGSQSQAVLPTPPHGAPYTGKWIKTDGAYGPYTSNELRDNYTSDMAGTWVWEVNEDSGILLYDDNGGVISGANRIIKTIEDADVTLLDENEVQRHHHELTGWNTKADKTGQHYDVGAAYTIPMGRTTILYAEWEDDHKRDYTVKHFQQKSDMTGYTLVDTEVIEANIGSVVIVEPKVYDGFTKPEKQTIEIPDNDRTVVEYYYNRHTYTVSFDGNGATSGQMADQTVIGGTGAQIRQNVFQKTGAIFTGWNTEVDGSGKSYVDQSTVQGFDEADNSSVILYAQWLENPNEALTPQNGEIYVKCKAGEMIVIQGLPAGTNYSIEEVDEPSGWKQTGTVGTDGTISAAQTNSAVITNRYEAEGVAKITAHKRLDGGDISVSQFQFELLDNSGNVLQTVSNGDVDNDKQIMNDEGMLVNNPYEGTAVVEFAPISYTQNDIGKTYIYKIREISGSDEIIYDSSEKIVTVRIEDAGNGSLSTSVIYEGEGEPVFVNKMKPASLEILKNAIKDGDNIEGEEFQFKIELFDKNGEELDGEFSAETMEKSEVIRVSHTPNIDDDGNKIGEFESGKHYSDIVTVQGAESIHIDLDYTNPRGYFWMWAQANEAVRTQSWTSSFNPGTTDKTIPTTGPEDDNIILHTSFDFPGDSISLAYACYAYPSDFCPENNGGYDPVKTNYGYYMKVSGLSDKYIDAPAVSSGDIITIKSGKSFRITGLPDGASYKITEKSKANWALISEQDSEGIVHSGITSTAIFTNRYEDIPYKAEGQAQLHAKKTLIGGTIKDEDGFVFELLDENGEIIQSKNVNQTGSSSSDITFDPISYTEADAAVPVEYDIQAMMMKDGESVPRVVTLDTSVYETVVNGTKMNISGTFTWDDEVFAGCNRRQVVISAVPKDNAYSEYAKQLVFDMSDKDSVEFSFNNLEKYVGGQYHYTIREQAGSDDHMKYDSATYGAKVTVIDSGEGYLQTSVEYEKGDDVVSEAEFKNTRLTDIHVIKKDADTLEIIPDAKFTIKSADNKYLHSDGTLSDEIEEFITDSQGRIDVDKVPAGTYTLHETEAPGEYTLAEDIVFSVDEEGVFVNHELVEEVLVLEELSTHDITLGKLVSGNMGNTNDRFIFIVQFTGDIIPDQLVSTFRYADGRVSTHNITVGESKTLRVALHHNESVTWSGIPHGAEYTITEEAADRNGYVTYATAQIGTVGADKIVRGTLTDNESVTYTNTCDILVLTGGYMRNYTFVILILLLIGVLYIKRNKLINIIKHIK